MKRQEKILVFLIVLLAALVSFDYGVLSVRYKLFPYRFLPSLYSSEAEVRSTSRSSRPPREKPPPPVKSEVDLKKRLSKLEALPYLQGTLPLPPEQGVLRHDRESAAPGVNIFTSAHAPVSYLMDMEGNILHRWRFDFMDVWPEKLDFYVSDVHKTHWRKVLLLEMGELLAIFDGIGMLKLDRDSKLIWSSRCRCHHDLWLAENGDIHTLTHRWLTSLEGVKLEQPVLVDYLTVLSPRGDVIRSVSLLDCFLNSPYRPLLEGIEKGGDFFHANSIEFLEGERFASSPILRPGLVLISIRQLDALALIDPEEEKVVWCLAGMWEKQHDPGILDNGNILLFDNLGDNGSSRVIEFSPLTQRVDWLYRGDPPASFFTLGNGAAQRLANGNTLVTESEKGRILEVSPDGRVVWEYVNVHRTGEDGELIAVIPEMHRLNYDKIPWLKQ